MIDPSKFLNDKLSAVLLAGQEAAPAILGGFFGQNRTDKSISPLMEQGVKDAYKRAQDEGADYVDYKHYGSDAGGLSARLTTGKMGFDEFKKDEQGNITGFTQRYDTDKTPMAALKEFNILKPNTYYKPFEAALAASQQRGVTTHDIDFRDQPVAAVTAPQPVADTPSTYTVKSGDTLSAISNETGVSLKDLMRMNAIQDANIIQIGQELKYK